MRLTESRSTSLQPGDEVSEGLATDFIPEKSLTSLALISEWYFNQSGRSKGEGVVSEDRERRSRMEWSG